MKRAIRLIIAAAGLSIAGCAANAQTKDIPQAPEGDLQEPMLYEFLLGEIALQRGDLPLAAQTFLDLARRTSDPRVARRAVEIANQARLPELALDAARTWQELDPASPQALQVLAALLVANKRAEEALPHLEKLLATEGVSPENGFMQTAMQKLHTEEKPPAKKEPEKKEAPIKEPPAKEPPAKEPEKKGLLSGLLGRKK